MYLTRFETHVILYVMGLVVMMFVFVLLHELAHVASARYYGVPTRAITLHPLGGVSMLERVPERPGQEALVGFAGPLVNLVIAAALLPIILVVHGAGAILHGLEHFLEPATWLIDLFLINILLGVFNLLPASPLDGGRVLRATLATKISYAKATRIAAFTGRFIAIGFVVFGLFWNAFFVLIGIFVFFGAAMEERSAQLMKLFAGLRVEDSMRTDIPTVAPQDDLHTVTKTRDNAAGLPVFVVEQGHLKGVIDRETLRYLQPKTGKTAASIMSTSYPVLTIGDDLSNALRQFAGGNHDAIPVVDSPSPRAAREEDGRYLGAITTTEMEAAYQRLRQEALARRAMRRRRKRGGPPVATTARVNRGDMPRDAEQWVPESPGR
jgi:Zn-dependent protease